MYQFDPTNYTESELGIITDHFDTILCRDALYQRITNHSTPQQKSEHITRLSHQLEYCNQSESYKDYNYAIQCYISYLNNSHQLLLDQFLSLPNEDHNPYLYHAIAHLRMFLKIEGFEYWDKSNQYFRERQIITKVPKDALDFTGTVSDSISVKIEKCPGKGLGLFSTTHFIENGTVIGALGHTDEYLCAECGDIDASIDYIQTSIGGSKFRVVPYPFIYINHSCDPNVKFEKL